MQLPDPEKLRPQDPYAPNYEESQPRIHRRTPTWIGTTFGNPQKIKKGGDPYGF